MPNSSLILPVVAVLLAAAAVAVAAVVLRNARRRPESAPRPSPPADPFADIGETQGDPLGLKVGDMLDFGVERTWIRGTLRLAEGGAVWAEHFIEVEGGRRWLSVEQDPDVQMALWTGRPDLDLTPHGPEVELDGVRYRLTERGSASYRSEGTTGLRAEGGMDYADYESADGRLLSFERFDHGRWEPSTGVPITRAEFTVYPGGG
ncbi:DUF4178 domain-containing protein [Streptomonospora nanhaiensis]|uniref:DUF4178 domain-containing protein n=1 Tax=Streptomonospora nanhaiensis TaxID=1323731 RepID=A0A853BSJ2_9ACTN|nr:DUF4178 domain-containing protein [Streptomonospora nanhaiensis]MBV2362801.1 DUF4178 domain-containing protein [Streptomonospora nanhaiensis]MBX9386970.1 DUF4178 domain-containing protein [Streptomonospora nanhaiensis]NYI97844.1 hypothetical protein [Streptomonospora nanhaiensis]